MNTIFTIRWRRMEICIFSKVFGRMTYIRIFGITTFGKWRSHIRYPYPCCLLLIWRLWRWSLGLGSCYHRCTVQCGEIRMLSPVCCMYITVCLLISVCSCLTFTVFNSFNFTLFHFTSLHFTWLHFTEDTFASLDFTFPPCCSFNLTFLDVVSNP